LVVEEQEVVAVVEVLVVEVVVVVGMLRVVGNDWKGLILNQL